MKTRSDFEEQLDCTLDYTLTEELETHHLSLLGASAGEEGGSQVGAVSSAEVMTWLD